jgi:hypothetical protein
MTTELADILFKKTNCSFKIKDREWLTESQIIEILGKTSDYNSFQEALTNEKLSPGARESWFKQMISQQYSDELSLKQPLTGFNRKIAVALSGLKLKSYKLSLKAINNKEYTDAASASFELYNQLDLAFKDYIKNQNLPKFKQCCSNHINEAMPILGVHRSYKQALLDILNVICTGLTGGYYYRKNKTNWRFFKTDTDSVNVVNQFKQKLGIHL